MIRHPNIYSYDNDCIPNKNLIDTTPVYSKPTLMEVGKALHFVSTGKKYRRVLYKARLMSSNRKQKMITGIRHNELIDFLNSFIEKKNNSMVEISGGINQIWAILIVILFFIFEG